MGLFLCWMAVTVLNVLIFSVGLCVSVCKWDCRSWFWFLLKIQSVLHVLRTYIRFTFIGNDIDTCCWHTWLAHTRTHPHTHTLARTSIEATQTHTHTHMYACMAATSYADRNAFEQSKPYVNRNFANQAIGRCFLKLNYHTKHMSIRRRLVVQQTTIDQSKKKTHNNNIQVEQSEWEKQKQNKTKTHTHTLCAVYYWITIAQSPRK